MITPQNLLDVEAKMKEAERELDKLTAPLLAGPKLVKDFTVQIGGGIVEGLKLIERSANIPVLLTCYKIEVAVYKAILQVLNEQAGKA